MPAQDRRRALLLAAALAVATVAAYGRSFSSGFVWDDGYIIVENPQTRDLGAIGTLALSPDVVKPYYRPLTRISYLLDHAAFGMDPRAFHAVNVAIHVANVLLLFALGLRLLGSAPGALVAAALLAVHPINAEAVSFVSARNNLLALCFSLLSAHLLLRAWERGRPWLLATLSAAAWFLALLSKESAAAVILFLAGLLVSPLAAPEVPLRRRLLALAPHGAAAAGYVVLRRLALGGVVGEGLGLGSVVDALRVNWHVVPRYLELLVFPARLNLLHRTPEGGPGAEPGLAVVWIALVALVVLLVRSRSVPTLLGLLWVAVNYAPIANLVPIPSAAMAERFAYLPAVGIWMVVGDWAGRGWARAGERGRAVAALAAGTIVLALGVRTHARGADWRDEVALFGAIVRVDPGSAIGHYNLGCALQERGDLAGATRAWERTLALEPGHAGAHGQLGTVAATSGDLAGAERHYLAAVAGGTDDPMVHYNLALVYERTGRPAQALAAYERFLRGAGPEHEDRVARALERRAALARAPAVDGRAR
jgi:tetratricopeptide (TPR) repeat protein